MRLSYFYGEKGNMKKEQKYEYVKSLRLAGWLMFNGFRILRIIIKAAICIYR